MNAGIAIVGMACRYPDANSPDELWQMVLAGRRAFRRLPEERLRLSDYAMNGGDDPDGIYPIEAAVLENYAFDRSRFRIPARALAAADTTHWLALEVATDALADAGLLDNAHLHRDTAGVIVGNTLTGEFSRAGLMRLRFPYVRRRLDAALTAEGIDPDWRTAFLERFEDAFKAPFPPPDEETLAGGLTNTIAGRICNHHDWHGGGYTVDGACASSLLAVADACRLLSAGELDTALAGGVDLSLDPFELVGFARNGALSRTVMRVFDARSDGFWPGEGCGFVVLMREHDARRAGLPVHAVIRGWAMSTDGAGGLTRPTVAGQREAIQRAWRRAGISPGEVPLFEAHGTGTAVGDPVEIAAIAGARAADGIACPAVVGSIKGNIGHTKAAAGIAGLLKATLALRHQVLPAATGCEHIHPAMAEHADAVRVATESRVWPAAWPLLAGVSATGFGGINLHLALQGVAPSRRSGFTAAEQQQIVAPQDAELFLFSAADRGGLRGQFVALAEIALRLSRAELADAAARCARALSAGASPVRAMVVATTPVELAARLALSLRRLDAGAAAIEPDHGIAIAGATAGAPRIALVFPGQAAPVRGEGGVWRRRFPALEPLYQAAELPSVADPVATERAQPAIIVDCLAGLAMLRRIGMTASIAVGHSVGELAALHWGGAFDAEAALRLARVRGRAMADLAKAGGAMALIGAAPPVVEQFLTGTRVRIACLNAPAEQVIAGDAAAVAGVIERAAREGLMARPLTVSHAFHTDHMAQAADAVRQAAGVLPMTRLRRPVVSTVTGRLLPEDALLPDLLGRQVTEPVRFAEAMMACVAQADLAIEVGAGHGLARLIAAQTTLPIVSLDVGGSSLSGLLTAAGTVFVMGGQVDTAALFSDRFVRDFDLARPRRFLANPCERAPDTAAPRRRTVSPPVILPAPSLPATATPMEALRAALARRLDLDIATIAPEHRLLGDLHLNSIAVGQIVVETARALGRKPPSSVTNFANATVAEAAATLAASDLAAEAEHDPHPPGVASWIRCFAVAWEERPVAAPVQHAPARWHVAGDRAHPLADQLPHDPSGPSDAVALLLAAEPALDQLSMFLDAAGAIRAAGSGATLLVVGAAGAAFARCLSQEYPDARVRVVDLPAGHPDAMRWIAAELGFAAPGYVEARYTADGVRCVPVLRLAPIPEPARTPILCPHDVVLVSGGARGIGAECALALARSTGARLALLGRSPAEAPEVAASMARLRAAHVVAQYEQADVTDAAAVATAVARLRQAVGPVTAILHAAGVNQPTALAQLDLKLLDTTVRVKTFGLANLLAATDPGRLRLLVGFGSIIARVGLPGEAHYALANDWLADAVSAFGRAHPACRALTIEWSVWAGVGMGEALGAVEALGSAGVTALPVPDATELFTSVLAAPSPHRRVVVSGRMGAHSVIDLGRPLSQTGRFLDHPRVFYPGIELVADATLQLATDPYLAEHALAATPLLPAVLGLEAMAQAAAALTGGVPVQFEDLAFIRPVAVGEQGAKVRVAGLCRADGEVELVLRCGDEGFQTDHFRATAVSAAPDRAIGRIALPGGPNVVDSAVLYNRLLFHTGRFRRVDGYSALTATLCVARIAAVEPGRWFAGRADDGLVLGDPAVRDAALHALQACVPHRRVLPVAAKRVQLGALRPDRDYVVHGRETAREADHFVFDVDICAAGGEVVERWEGLTLRAIEALPAPVPWPPGLAAVYAERRLGELFPAGTIRIALVEGADCMPPPSEQLLEALLPASAKVWRRPDGRPEAPVAVSAAHAGPLTLAVAGGRETGCDLEALFERPESLWRGLLGHDHLELARLIAGETRETLSEAATRVWTAAEALKKTGADSVHAPMVLNRVDAGWVVLSASDTMLATWLGPLPQGAFALAVASRVGPAQVVPLRAQPAMMAPASPAWSYRHIVGFGDTNLVGNVYFVNHLEWQGRCREMFLRDKAPSVIADLADGLALVTVRCSCDYLAELAAFDEVRLDMRLNQIIANRIAFRFDYWRCNGSGDELVAVGEQEVACLRNTGAGKQPTDIPPDLLAALMPYRSDQPRDTAAHA